MLLSSTQALVFISYDYDYIIIGGGTAGLILAARLSANPAIVVGVLEAGEWQNDNPIVYIPGLHRASIGTPLDWNFTTVPQTHVNNRVISHPLGKMLGGSSGLNFMNWCVASRGEYDWGLGWNWDAISDGWKKAEGVYPPVLQTQIDLLPKPYVNTRFHGHDGPVGMSFARWFPSSTSAILPSLRKLGVKENPDPMGGDNTGGYYCLSSIDGANVTRSTSATAFLEPNLERKNLIVLTGVTVSRIVFNNKVASGVEFLDKSGTTHTAKLNTDPKSEVILSAGSLQSPQILELSGIGKKSVLEAAGVPLLVRNDNVGENLQDHTCATRTFESSDPITRDFLRSDPAFAAAARTEYDTNRTGILTSSTLTMAMIPLTWILTTSELAALTNATLSQNPTLDPFRTHTLPRTAEDSEVAQVEIIIMPNKVSATPPTPGKTYLSLFAINLHPLSRGSVHIASSNPLSPPVIDPRYYSEPVDKAIMLAAMKFAEKITQQEPLKGFIKERADVAEPGDEGLWDLIMRTTDSAKHPLGTCALGEKNKGGVVDGSLRIYGVQGLRVVDASVIPLQISTHTQATVYGIAERAAEIILGERGGRYR